MIQTKNIVAPPKKDIITAPTPKPTIVKGNMWKPPSNAKLLKRDLPQDKLVSQEPIKIDLASKLSNLMVSISLKKLVKILFIKAQVMEVLGLKVEKKDKMHRFDLSIDMSPFLNKLNMPVSLQELLKVPSISNKVVRCLGMQPKARIPKQMPKITKDPLVMIQSDE